MGTLNPVFQVKDADNALCIISYIPGLRKKDIDVSVNPGNRELKIQGVRLPSQRQEMTLRHRAISKYGSRISTAVELDDIVLESGRGVFGSFSESYRINIHDFDTEDITVSYNNDTLKVTIPYLHTARNSVESRYPRAKQAWNDGFWYDFRKPKEILAAPFNNESMFNLFF